MNLLNFLYEKTEKIKAGAGFKIFLFLGIFSLVCAICGLFVGMIFTIIQGYSFRHNTILLICFAGYPAFFIGLVGGCVYLMRK